MGNFAIASFKQIASVVDIAHFLFFGIAILVVKLFQFSSDSGESGVLSRAGIRKIN